MRQFSAFGLCFVAAVFVGRMSAQGAADAAIAPVNKGIELAERQLTRVQSLVEVGALPRNRLQQAEADVRDAQDEVILAHALYGDLPDQGTTADASAEMIAAAERRLGRQQARIEEARKMVAAGVTALSYLSPFEAELAARQTSLDLARMRARLMSERATQAATTIETQAAPRQEPLAGLDAGLFSQGMERYDGSGTFQESRDLRPLELAFQSKFAQPLPISAEGETELHRSLGFDHRGRVDVAVNPSEPEGIWLRQYLKLRGIPYYAFAHAVPGKATAAHIHIGPGSTRLSSRLSVHLSTHVHNAD